jgi:hypothetical protein
MYVCVRWCICTLCVCVLYTPMHVNMKTSSKEFTYKCAYLTKYAYTYSSHDAYTWIHKHIHTHTYTYISLGRCLAASSRSLRKPERATKISCRCFVGLTNLWQRVCVVLYECAIKRTCTWLHVSWYLVMYFFTLSWAYWSLKVCAHKPERFHSDT